MAAIDNYLHYWFSNSGMTLADLSDEKRKSITWDLLLQFQDRQDLMMKKSTDLEEAEKVMSFLMGDQMNTKRQELFNSSGGNNNGPRLSGLGNYTYKQLGYVSPQEIQALVDELANGLDDFITHFENFLDSAYNSLMRGGNFETYAASVINEFINSNGRSNLSQSELRSQIISGILTHNGLQKLKIPMHQLTGQSSLDTALRNLTLLAYALPELKSGNTSYNWSTKRKAGGTTDSLGQILSILGGKIDGSFSSVVGIGGEIAALKAEETGAKEILSRMGYPTIGVSGTVVGGNNITVIKKTKQDSKADENQTETIQSRSTSDVNIKVTANGVVIEYGMSVKTYQPSNASGLVGSVKIVDETPFLVAAHKANFSDYYLVNLAAAHGSGGRDFSIKNGDLENSWNQLVEQVTLQNFLDFVAGSIADNQDNVLFLVINGQAFSISYILSQLMSNNLSLTSSLKKENNYQLNRDSLMKLNKWKYIKGSKSRGKSGWSKDAAYERSSEGWSGVIGALQTAKLTVDLNFLTKI